MSTTPLRIALISETFPPEINGVANTLGRLAAGLLQLGHRVQVVRPRQHVDDGRHSDDELLLTRGWPLPGYPGLQWGQSCLHKLLRHWRRLRPDVLYIATEGPLGLAALRAARRLRIPALSGFHTNFQQYSAHYGLGPLTRLVTAYLRWFHNRTQRTLVPSASQALELERRGFAHLAQLARGVDGQLFQPGRRDDALRREWGLGEQDIAVLHVGRVVDGDGQPVANAMVKLDYWNDSARELSRQLGKGETPVRADAAGRFRLEGVLPDIPFELFFRNGQTSLVLYPRKPTGKAVAGDTLDLRDLRPRPSE